MATDPVRQIQREEIDTPYDLNLRKALTRLAAAPPSPDAPYLTVSLDWRPEGSQPHTRYARQVFAEQVQQILENYEPRTLAHDSLTADIERVVGWLDSEADPSAQGIFIVACLNTNVFHALSLNIPLETRVVVGATPSLAEVKSPPMRTLPSSSGRMARTRPLTLGATKPGAIAAGLGRISTTTGSLVAVSRWFVTVTV